MERELKFSKKCIDINNLLFNRRKTKLMVFGNREVKKKVKINNNNSKLRESMNIIFGV